MFSVDASKVEFAEELPASQQKDGESTSKNVLWLLALGFTCVLCADELLGYNAIRQMPSILGLSLSNYSFYMGVQVAGSATLLVVLFTVPGLISFKYVCSASAFCWIMGAMGSFASLVALGFSLEVWSLLLECIGAIFLKLMMLDTLMRLDDRRRNATFLMAIVFQAVVSPLCYLDAELVLMLAGLFGIAAVASLVRGRKSTVLSFRLSLRETTKRSSIAVLKVIIAVAVISICCAFFSPMSYVDVWGGPESILFTLSTHLIGSLLFGVFLGILGDESFSLALRLVFTMCVISFGLVPVFGSASWVPAFFNTIAYSFFTYVCILAVARFASMTAGDCYVPFLGYLLLVGGASLSGAILSQINSLLSVGTTYSGVAVAVLVVVIVTALWGVRDKDLQNFFWGNQVGSLQNFVEETGDGKTMEDKVIPLSDQYELSPRERDVLELVAEGRSASVIAEMLYLSESTVRKHVGRIYQKCGVHSKQELLAIVHESREETL